MTLVFLDGLNRLLRGSVNESALLDNLRLDLYLDWLITDLLEAIYISGLGLLFYVDIGYWTKLRWFNFINIRLQLWIIIQVNQVLALNKVISIHRLVKTVLSLCEHQILLVNFNLVQHLLNLDGLLILGLHFLIKSGQE